MRSPERGWGIRASRLLRATSAPGPNAKGGLRSTEHPVSARSASHDTMTHRHRTRRSHRQPGSGVRRANRGNPIVARESRELRRTDSRTRIGRVSCVVAIPSATPVARIAAFHLIRAPWRRPHWGSVRPVRKEPASAQVGRGRRTCDPIYVRISTISPGRSTSYPCPNCQRVYPDVEES